MHEDSKLKHDFESGELRKEVKDMFHVEDTSGIELFRLLHRVSHLSEAIAFGRQGHDDIDLSGPRWRLMLSLLIAEKRGAHEGLTPTALSEHQRVSKNTVSALLRGLEEQGLIQRNLDSKDFRVFRIQLTESGLALMKELAPQRLNAMNDMLVDLNSEERKQLISLLEKLQLSLMNTCKAKGEPFERNNERENTGED